MAIDIFHMSDSNQNINQNHRSTTHENEFVPHYESCIPQLLATTAVSISKFCFGTLVGFNTIMIAELYDGKAGITMSLHEITWFSSYLFMEPVGSIIASLFIERVGNRSAILFSMFLYITIWLMFYNSNSVAMLLITQAITGLLYLVPLVGASTYIAEISQPHLRSRLMAYAQLFSPSGIIFTTGLSIFVDWRTIAFLNISFPIIAFIAVYSIPENPEWLSRKGRLVEMETASAWLRGTKMPKPRKTCYKVSSSSKKQENNVDDPMTNEPMKMVLKLYMQRSFYLPLMLCFIMFIIYNFSGLVTVGTYSTIIFQMIDSPINEYVATTLLHIIEIVAQITCISIINYAGKRRLMLISTINVGLSFLIFSLLLCFKIQRIFYSPMILVIMIMMGSFLGSVGFESVINMIYIELFPRECRVMGVGIVFMFNTFLSTFVDKIFLHVVELITLQGVFFAFALVNFIGFFLFFFIVPDTNERTLGEIEDHYANVRSFKNCSRIEKKNVCVNADLIGDTLASVNLYHI